MSDVPNLHDALFLRAVLSWGKVATASIVFRVFGPRFIVLKATGVTNLGCPHENPWGPSVHVNEIRGPLLTRQGVERIEIEVQSGDTIVIDAASFEWAESDRDPVSTAQNDDGLAPD